MLLHKRNIGPAIERLHALPQTKQVFAVGGQSGSCVLVWVRKDGTRRTLNTQEQVEHALSKRAYL